MKYTKSYKKVCPMCGKEFEAHTALQKYCDAVCYYEHANERNKEYYRLKSQKFQNRKQ